MPSRVAIQTLRNEERAQPAVTAQRLDGVRFEFRVASSAWLTRDRSAHKKMNTQEDSKIERKRRRLKFIRVIVGAAVIVAVLAVVTFGVAAFAKDRDAWSAMSVPMIITVFLIWGFTRSAKAIAALEVSRHR